MLEKNVLIFSFTLLSPNQSSVDELQSRFNVYERSQAQVDHILQYWERALGLLLVPLPADENLSVSEEVPSEKQVILHVL